jgi:hypothetical protein
VSYSALFIRNLYQPFVKAKSDRHFLTVGRVAIVVTLLGGVGVALFIGNLLDLYKYFISLPAVFRSGHLAGVRLAARDENGRHRPGLRFAVYAPHPEPLPVLGGNADAAGLPTEAAPRVLTIDTGP